MLSALRKLFSSPGAGPEKARHKPGGEVRPGKKSKYGYGPAGVSIQEIDAAFYGLILGVQSPIDSVPNVFEKKVLRELDRFLSSNISHSSMVPRLPAVIPRVLGTLRDETASAADLAAELGRDAVLVSEVIRLANSPYYSVGKKITSLERAVFILGQVGVRQLVANAALKPILNLNSGHFTRLSGTVLWDQSEKTAIVCDCLARQEKTDRFNAYLMAIVQNVGFKVALQILDRNFDGAHAPRSGRFQERLVSSSRKLSWMIASQWGFPENVLDALESQIDDRRMQLTGNILYVADKLSKIHILSSLGRFNAEIDPVTERLQERLNLSRSICFETLAE